MVMFMRLADMRIEGAFLRAARPSFERKPHLRAIAGLAPGWRGAFFCFFVANGAKFGPGHELRHS